MFHTVLPQLRRAGVAASAWRLPLRSATRVNGGLWQTSSRSFAKEVAASAAPAGSDTRVYTTKLERLEAGSVPTIPSYRVMDEQGKIVEGATDPKWSEEKITELYKYMVRVQVMDAILNDVQRQGRISFYMTAKGEEGIHFGTASALDPRDTIFGQYREQGVLMYRGFTLEQIMHQCYSNAEDLGKGRQMPVHYGSKEHNFQTISSPLATQIPQASGAAYAQKILGMDDVCTVVFFGEGAASEGDFHAALNFAATLECPVIFFCRNNGFAISTPSKEQFRGDGIASRAVGYGIDALRCDGNDIFAVHETTARAREYCIKERKPIVVEAMTYRVGHHSTSDDSTRYRPAEEIESWASTNNPILRCKTYMEDRGYWNDEKEEEIRTATRKEVLECLAKGEKTAKPAIEEMFTDVYDELPENLQQQRQELKKHLDTFGYHYPLDKYADGSEWGK